MVHWTYILLWPFESYRHTSFLGQNSVYLNYFTFIKSLDQKFVTIRIIRNDKFTTDFQTKGMQKVNWHEISFVQSKPLWQWSLYFAVAFWCEEPFLWLINLMCHWPRHGVKAGEICGLGNSTMIAYMPFKFWNVRLCVLVFAHNEYILRMPWMHCKK